jgi:predicted porin
VGQPISGLNILANSFITVVGATTVTINQATASSGAATGNVVTPGLQAGAVGSTTQNAAPFGNNQFAGLPSAAALAADVPGCPFWIPESQSIFATFAFIPAYGEGNLSLTSGTTAAQIQQQTSAGSWTTIFTGTASTTVWVLGVTFDYGNVRINFPVTAGSFIFYRFRGGGAIG